MGLFDRSAERRRQALLRKLPGPASGTSGQSALYRYLATPLPEPSTPIRDLRLLAIDAETTGLDPSRDQMLSVGFVPLDPLPASQNSASQDPASQDPASHHPAAPPPQGAGTHEIVLGGSGSLLVRPQSSPSPSSLPHPGVGDSATVHGLTDDRVATGRPLTEVIDHVLDALAGRVLLAHFTRIEVGHLTRAVRDLHGIDLPVVSIDTLELQFRIWGSDADRIPNGALRLWAARDQYGLPEYPAHDAYVDALACAELFLAQLADEQLPLGARTLRDLQ